MAASGGALSPPAPVASPPAVPGPNIQTSAKARFPGRPGPARVRLRAEKRTKRGRLGSEDGEQAPGPRPLNLGLAFGEDPCLLRLLGVSERHGRQKDAGFVSSSSEGEEDFSGFGTTTLLHSPLRQSQSPPSADMSPGTKLLLGKIVQKTQKPAVIAATEMMLEVPAIEGEVTVAPSTDGAEATGTGQRFGLSGANKRMLQRMLRKAKVQLIKIDQQKQLKITQESMMAAGGRRQRRKRGLHSKQRKPQEQALPGPRIKHVCRAAAVALGQPRAMVPDDIPRLSALPMHEREGISFSPTLEDAVEDELSDPDTSLWEPSHEHVLHKRRNKKKFRRSLSSHNHAGGRRSRRCGDCDGCMIEEDCSKCAMCLDKPKFGGSNVKKQCCIYRRCERIERAKLERVLKPYKIRSEEYGASLAPFAPSEDRKKSQRNVKRRSYSSLLLGGGDDDDPGNEENKNKPVNKTGARSQGLSSQDGELVSGTEPGKHRRIFSKGFKPRSNKEQPEKSAEEMESSLPLPDQSPPRSPLPKLQIHLYRLPDSVLQANTQAIPKLCCPASPKCKDQKPLNVKDASPNTDAPFPSRSLNPEPEPSKGALTDPKDTHADGAKEDGGVFLGKEIVVMNCHNTDTHYFLRPQNPEYASLNGTGLTNGFSLKGLLQTKYKIRVDFKEDCALENVWLMGGLSVLSSLPNTPQPVCLLCASQGQHEMLYCQICCEPFHSFCLLPEERPEEENKENWCCRRCKFCHVCGRKSKSSKPVLQCRRCQTSYHPSCLGPTYPKPLNCDVPWICMTCIRCRSCGVTRGKTWDLAWNQKQDLCPDCTTLFEKGNFCTICKKCYEDNSQHEQIQCSKCNHWIHAKCEGISEEMFELFSSLSEEMPFTCSPCCAPEPSGLKGELQSRLTAQLQEVITDLLSSSATQHLLICKRCCESKLPESNSEHVVCDLQAIEMKFKSALYDSVKNFHVDVASVLRNWQKEEETLPEDQRRTNSAKDHYVKLMQRIFVWFPSSHFKTYNLFSEEFPSGMLAEAVLPPSKEHSYAQWMERAYQQRAPLSNLSSLALQTRSFVHDHEYNKAKDGRQCSLCQQLGDAAPSDQGRLLYMGQNEWAHVNCCLWSAEVYEDNGALLQVHSAVSRGRHLRCDRCGQSGATVGCCLVSCQSNFHFMCARSENCVFQHDRNVYCNKHRDLISDKVVVEFEVPRRVYVDFQGINLRRKFLTGLDPETINMSIGSLQIHKLGVLTELSSNGRALYPVGYQCSRLYWSTVDPRRRCKYTCKVTEVSTPLPGEEQDAKYDQGENHTIVHSPKHHRDLESMECERIPVSPVKSNTPSPKTHNTSGSKSPIYPLARRPAVGSSRPLPSPGTAPPKPHHIVTLRDLEDTRRTRRLSSRSRCSSSPSEPDPPAPASLRSGSVRTSLFSSPPRSAAVGPLSPPLSRQNSTSPVWGSPTTSGFSPHRGSVSNSPKGRQSFKITTPISAEVPQDFLASSEAEEAAVATTNGISLAPENLEEEVAQLMAQELPYTVFDADVTVDQMLNAKLEFDDNLLSENIAFGCHTNKGESEIVNVDNCKQENEPEEDESSHYLKFSRTVVDVPASSNTPSLTPAQSIMQLDGADGESDSDDSEIVEKQTQSVALKQLESICSGQSTQIPSSSSDLDKPFLLDAETGHFTSPSGTVINPKNKTEDDFDSSSSSSSSDESAEGFKDDLNDPDYDPDYAPELSSPKKTPPQVKPVLVKRHIPAPMPTPTPIPRKINLVVPQQHKVRLVLPSQAVGTTPGVAKAATHSTVPRTVTSPIVINGLNALPIQPGAPRGRSIAIRLNNTKPAGQQPGAPNQAATANAAAVNPTPQVLLVNRQGQILIKDPRSNTYQAVSTNSPAYNKISQIAKLLHSGNPLQRNLSRVLVRPSIPSTSETSSQGSALCPQTSTAHVSSAASISLPTPAPSVSASGPAALTLPASVTVPSALEGQTSVTQKRIVFRMVKTVPASFPATSPAPIKAPEPPLTPKEDDDAMAQTIIDKAVASHRVVERTKPIIIRKGARKPKNPLAELLDTDQKSSPTDTPPHAFSRNQGRVKRVSSQSEKSSRKKSKVDYLVDASDPDDSDSKSSGVRMKAPSMKDVLDLDEENKIDPLKVVTPPAPRLCRYPRADVLPANIDGKTHKWVSSRHGDLSEWGPYSGVSSEDEWYALKFRKKTCMNQPHLRFEITSDDGFSVKANSIEVAWRAVIDGVLEARADFHLKQLPLGGMNGPRVMGILHDAVLFILEQLHGAADCKQHRFRFHRCENLEEELPLNPSGCTRSEVYTRKATFDMFNFLASQHRALPEIVGPFEEEDDDIPLKSSRRFTSTELPMAMRFRHLEKISKEAVGVYRSAIHGRGLFCKRNIEAGEMVIEYAGAVIRAVLTDKREKYYDSKGIGCYMFRIDDFDVVDATMQGNAARFINHSCEPNCYSRVINVDGRKHIVIFALRKIYRGEELTYDYKFPIEDADSKLHCNCGTRKCRRFLN
uniref:[histone H3]-lysine(4) N-methyltransferase n=1 Tax=Knipowitschia caucasica TaxID=637954 RepID=A0AAV2K9P8_KNICA